MKNQFNIEYYGVSGGFAPNPLKGAYFQYSFSPPSGGMGGEFNGVIP